MSGRNCLACPRVRVGGVDAPCAHARRDMPTYLPPPLGNQVKRGVGSWVGLPHASDPSQTPAPASLSKANRMTHGIHGQDCPDTQQHRHAPEVVARCGGAQSHMGWDELVVLRGWVVHAW